MKRISIVLTVVVSAGWIFSGCVSGGGQQRSSTAGSEYLWPVKIPRAAQPAEYEKVIHAAMKELKAPLELLGFDCSYPPCIAKFRDPPFKAKELHGTRAWRKGLSACSFISREVDCGVEGIERATFLAAHWGPGVSSMDRMKDLLKQWVCASGKKAWQLQEEEEKSSAARAVAWPEDMPEQYLAKSFEVIMGQVMEEIDLKADLLGLECSEPPCIAMFRVHPDNKEHPTSASVWQSNFAGASASNFQGPLGMGACSDERVLLVAPVWTPGVDSKGLSVSEYSKKAQAFQKTIGGKKMKKRLSTRLKARWQKIRETWKCKVE